MGVNNYNDLLVDELRDIYHAEKQLTKALPKMVKAANSDELRQAFEAHLEETFGQIERLEKAFSLLEVPARAKKCEAMEGLVKEGSETIEEEMPAAVKDVALISAAQKVEHYEIAAYRSVCALAESLGLEEVASVLADNLTEEEAADKKLSAICGSVMESESLDDEDLDEEEEEMIAEGGKQ